LKFQIDDKVLAYLQTHGCADITLDVEELPTSCCIGRLPEMKISLSSPADVAQYRAFCAQGINIYLSNLLRTQETLTFFLSGFGPFKRLEVGGVNLVL
jgi:hypothetical protein